MTAPFNRGDIILTVFGPDPTDEKPGEIWVGLVVSDETTGLYSDSAQSVYWVCHSKVHGIVRYPVKILAQKSQVIGNIKSDFGIPMTDELRSQLRDSAREAGVFN